MKLDTVTSNAAGAWGGVLAITTLTCRAQANGANSLALSVRMLSCGLLAVLILFTGCARETLFKSNFDQTPIGQPPSHAQAVGTANVDGPAGSVVVVAPPVTASGKWVQISQPGEPQFVASLQGILAQVRGDGTYTFSTILFIPSGSGPATIRFESQEVVSPDLPTVFLHLDFMPDNRVRIDDDPGTLFGTFPRDQVFYRSSDAEHQCLSSHRAHRVVWCWSLRSGGLHYHFSIASRGAAVWCNQTHDGLSLDGKI